MLMLEWRQLIVLVSCVNFFTPNLLDLYPTIFLQGLNSYDLGDVKFCIVSFVKGTM
jgi:hypothetical protein